MKEKQQFEQMVKVTKLMDIANRQKRYISFTAVTGTGVLCVTMN